MVVRGGSGCGDDGDRGQWQWWSDLSDPYSLKPLDMAHMAGYAYGNCVFCYILQLSSLFIISYISVWVWYYRELNCSVYILQTTLLKIMFIYLFRYLYTGKCCLMAEYVTKYNVINRTCKDYAGIWIFAIFIFVLLHLPVIAGCSCRCRDDVVQGMHALNFDELQKCYMCMCLFSNMYSFSLIILQEIL